MLTRCKPLILVLPSLELQYQVYKVKQSQFQDGQHKLHFRKRKRLCYTRTLYGNIKDYATCFTFYGNIKDNATCSKILLCSMMSFTYLMHAYFNRCCFLPLSTAICRARDFRCHYYKELMTICSEKSYEDNRQASR